MLSILIPVKDYNCSLLIEALHAQGERLQVPYEILIGEDGSSQELLTLNAIADRLPNCRRIIKETNVGRAAIRNLLAAEAQYPNLIFIDCDAAVERENFLADYLQALKECPVVCGGLYHPDKQPGGNCSLRYKYEKQADKFRDAATRSKAPYDKFTTFCFAIRREVFEAIRFDTSITEYGYEDALFGKELKRRSIAIKHIDNPLMHTGLEENRIYLSKIERSLHTLAGIKEKIGSTALTNAAGRLERSHLTWLFMIFWRAAKPLIVKNLLGTAPSLKALNIYKLGYYIQCRRGKQIQ